MSTASARTLWSGRFGKAPDKRLMRLSRADASHARLIPHDIAGSRAHARELAASGVLESDELDRLLAALAQIEADFHAGAERFDADDEDIHTWLERVLVGRLGPLGAKLRAGRSRNDQAANDLKHHLRAVVRTIARDLADLIGALMLQAERHLDTPAMGMTHLQPAQPVSFGHHLLAHAQALSRDLGRFADWLARADECPLGAAALGGSALARHPAETARALGYARSFENSIDAVSARDHVAEFLFASAMASVHVSRLAEEIVLWSTRQFAWIEIDDAFATGSSIMPQKKNPDIAELARGRAARLIGDLVTMLTALKGLPLAYNRDLAEDKRAVFDAADVLDAVLPAMAGLVATMRIDADRIARDAGLGHTLATEIADRLAHAGIPFARAHEATGELVRSCLATGRDLTDATPDLLPGIPTDIAAGSLADLTVGRAIAERDAAGGTAPSRVREQSDRLRARLDALLARIGRDSGDIE